MSGFVFQTKNVVKWPVVIKLPQNGGKTVDKEVTATFDLITQSESAPLIREGGDKALLLRVTSNWEGIVDESGAAIQCNDTNKAQLFDVDFVQRAFALAYMKAVSGVAAKN